MAYESQSEPPPPDGKRSIVNLARDFKDEFLHLFRATTQLLRIELSENVENATAALGRTLVGYAIVSISGLMLLIGIDLLIIDLLAPEIMSYQTAAPVATLGLAVILGIVGAILVRRSRKAIQPEKLIPDRTLSTLGEHAEWISRKAEDLKQP